MELQKGDEELERLNHELNDSEVLHQYKARYDDYKPALVPRLLGAFLVGAGNLFYGKEPNYLKFRAVEVIARVPYHSWVSAAYTLLTMCYKSEQHALRLSKVTRYARLSQDNETMHVVVISHLCTQIHAGWIRYTFIPMVFAFFYFWWSYVLYLVNPRYSYELNYVFESHAFEQYDTFLRTRGDELRKKPIMSEFLTWYGRHPRSEYEFFLSVRNDEMIHRNHSIDEIGL